MPERRRAVLAALAALLAVAPAAARRSDAPDLGAAIRSGDTAAVAAALDPNARLAFGATPLAWAVDGQDAAMVALLLKRGARPDMADSAGETPLALACELGDAGVVDALLAAGADVRRPGPGGAAPLAICAGHGPAAAVARMLAEGAPADAPDDAGLTPLMWAAASGRTDAMALLVKAGADVNRVTSAGFTPLFFAIKSGALPATELLLAAHARTDHRGPERTSAAQLAVYQKNYAAAALLVARGAADVTERDRNGNQLLHAAAAGGDVPLIRALLAHGADPDGLTGPSRVTWVTEANFGVAPPIPPPTSPLLVAAAHGQADAMRALVAAGADARFVAADGTNVLLAAAGGANAATLDLALRLAPDPNAANLKGATALHLLIGGGIQPDLAPMMRLLAAHGARTDLRTKRGVTAAQLAANGLTEVRTVYTGIFGSPEGGAAATAKLADAGAEAARRATVAPSD